jgi:hypothetical protein
MALTKCNVVTNNISELEDQPNDVGGMTAAELKAAFDKFGAEFVAWFNATHIAEADAHLAENANKAHGGFKGALVRLTVNQSIPNETSEKIMWSGIVYDDLGIWNISNPSRLTVPQGVTKIRLIANTRWDFGETGRKHVTFNKNGTAFPGTAVDIRLSTNRSQANICTPVLNVTAGDYFEVVVYQDSGAPMNIAGESNSIWASMEVVE